MPKLTTPATTAATMAATRIVAPNRADVGIGFPMDAIARAGSAGSEFASRFALRSSELKAPSGVDDESFMNYP
jgi:hypothetical protein